MKTHLSKREIKKGYAAIKDLAKESFRKGDTDQSLRYIKHCAILAQQFNWIYSDEDLEILLQRIGERFIPEQTASFSPISGRVVFYDDFCTSFILALQYMRALVAAGKNILYITPKREGEKRKFNGIIPEVSSYPNVQVVSLPKGSEAEKTKFLYRTIIDYRPEKVLLHMKAYSVALPALYRLPSCIDRYIINLADQTFWLGSKAIDYSLEFRPFGATVSKQRRGLRHEQVLMLPFYPVVDNYPFDGFPPQCTDEKVVIFSGGDLYKVCSSNGLYWKLVKRILDTHNNVIFLFATKVDSGKVSIIKNFISANGFQDRFVYMSYRKDISEVFKHCDIYMGTCPASGSLMSQLAAIHGKPILQYYETGTPDDETEQAICINSSYPISFHEEDLFLAEATHLINDKSYRLEQGEKLKQALISKNQFDSGLSYSLKYNQSPFPYDTRAIDYSQLEDRWYDLEKTGFTDTLPYICGVLGGTNCFKKAPSIYTKKIIRQLFSS